MKFLLKTVVMLAVVVAGMGGGAVDTSVPGWIGFQSVQASPYRRSVRRTSRRTSRRTAARHSGGYYGGVGYVAPVVVGAAVVGAVAVGTMVATLPPACNKVVVNGVVYQNCNSVYYAPQGTQYIVVDDPY